MANSTEASMPSCVASERRTSTRASSEGLRTEPARMRRYEGCEGRKSANARSWIWWSFSGLESLCQVMGMWEGTRGRTDRNWARLSTSASRCSSGSWASESVSQGGYTVRAALNRRSRWGCFPVSAT